MKRGSKVRKELVARFEAMANEPPSNESKLLSRYYQCNEWRQMAGILKEALEQSTNGRDEALAAPSALLRPLA